MPLKSNFQKKAFERHELTKNTDEIKRHFSHFLNQLQQHMLASLGEGTLDVSVVKSHLAMYDKKLKVPMSHCKSLKDIFEVLVLPEHSSFLDYEVIKVLVDYGSNEIKSNFIEYKKRLQAFLENRIIEQSSGEEKSYAIVIDESITDEIRDLFLLENRVKLILGHKKLTLLHLETRPHSCSEEIAVEENDSVPSQLKASFWKATKSLQNGEDVATALTSMSDTLHEIGSEKDTSLHSSETGSDVAVGSDTLQAEDSTQSISSPHEGSRSAVQKENDDGIPPQGKGKGRGSKGGGSKGGYFSWLSQ